MLTKIQAYARINEFGSECSFLANVVLTRHKNPARRLKAIVALLDAGMYVKLAPFSTNVLTVDSWEVPWTVLDAKFPVTVAQLAVEQARLASYAAVGS